MNRLLTTSLLGVLAWQGLAGATLITQAEYFFDSDPGFGAGTAVALTAGEQPSFTADLSTAGLDPGLHRFYLRYQDELGRWSIADCRLFYLNATNDPPAQRQIVASEWFLDADPGFGSGTALTLTPGAEVSVTADLDLAGQSTGLHRFYLRQKGLGVLYFITTIGLFFFSMAVDGPVVFMMFLIAFIDAMVFLSMPQEEFDFKFNPFAQAKESRPKVKREKADFQRNTPQLSPAKASGIEKFRDYDIDGAIADFKKSLSEKFDDAAVHFNLACCYSMLEKADPAFFHLSKSVHFGFVDFDKIEKHDGLAWLRTTPDYQDFVKKGYQLVAALPAPEIDLLSQPVPERATKKEMPLLEQIAQLSELRKKGILTEEEYLAQTRRVLGN